MGVQNIVLISKMARTSWPRALDVEMPFAVGTAVGVVSLVY